MTAAPPLLWAPPADAVAQTQLDIFRRWCNEAHGLDLRGYDDLYAWSVEHIGEFWESLWRHLEIVHSSPYDRVVEDASTMLGAQWFSGARLNFAENLLRYRDDHIAIIARSERPSASRALTYAELHLKTRALAHAFRTMGIGQGDRVAALMPNIPETIVAMLAAASIGAIWTSCSPDFGVRGILDRFTQVAPKVLLVSDGYRYKGRWISLDDTLDAVRAQLPGLCAIIRVAYDGDVTTPPRTPLERNFVELTSDRAAPPLFFEQLPFDHPLYIMYSSGTTGLPKAIVHGAGGTLLQHLKEHRLHVDLRREDRLFYFTTCGWMMWNWLVSGLASGATIVLYDGAPFYPKPDALWRMVDEFGITVFGTSAKYLSHCEAMSLKPRHSYSLTSLRAILSTGSTLPEESFDYVYRDIKTDVQLASISGGTDIISCFALGCPTIPVHRGELQCRGLGMKVEVFDQAGNTVYDTKGELVCTAAFPSMPVAFWNDPGGSKYRRAYFERFPGIWHHGDYVSINSATRGLVIFGRSDATLNPGGVRIGTAEIYRAIEGLQPIHDSVAVGQKWQDDERVVLFVQMAEGFALDDDLRDTLRTRIREACTPRHVPALIAEVPEIPYTLNGKKVELAIRKILHGEPVLNQDALANPHALDHFRTMTELYTESR